MNIGLYEAKVLIGGLIVFIGFLMVRYSKEISDIIDQNKEND